MVLQASADAVDCGDGQLSASTTVDDPSTVNVSAVNTQSQRPAQQAPRQRTNHWGMIQAFAFRMFITYAVFSFFRGNKQPPPAPTTGPNGQQLSTEPSIIGPATNLFHAGMSFDLYAYVSESSKFDQFDAPLLKGRTLNEKAAPRATENLTAPGHEGKTLTIRENPAKELNAALVWKKTGLVYGDWTSGDNKDGTYTLEVGIPASESLMNNGSLYLHTYVVRSGNSPNPKDGNKYSKKFTIYKSKMLTRHKKRKLVRSVNLLTGETQAHSSLVASVDTPKDVEHLPACTHWHPNMTLNLVDDHTPWTQGSVPGVLTKYIKFYPPTNQYYPVLYPNDYWNLHEEYQPVNDTTPVLQFRLTYSPISLFRWQLYMAQSMRNSWMQSFFPGAEGEEANSDDGSENTALATTQSKQSGIQAWSSMMQEDNEEEQDAFKKTILETNPYLLAITVIVTIVHSVFEILAFKNDIQFWRTRESLEGLSVRSVFFNVFQSLIIVLYVLNNDTNFMVKVSVVLGLGIEIWKIKKVVTIKIDRENRLFGMIPRISFQDQASYCNTETKKYDQMAFRYLSWLLYPMLFCYCIYSLLYLEHRGWYSWVLSVLYGFLLIFGFITMTPQLFINYKMKSVAHLPWRMLTYKALNTFIDDLFAFVIRMPTLYRIGCFRDDIIFFIFLYQRWIYPIDPKRRNEFGSCQEDELKRSQGGQPEEVAEVSAVTRSVENESDNSTYRRTGATDTEGDLVDDEDSSKKNI